MSHNPAPYSREQLASLLAFYADAGLDFPVMAEAADFFQPVEPPQSVAALRPQLPAAQTRAATRTPDPVSAAPVVPDSNAIALAETAAAAAQDLDQLAATVARFDGCNLKRSARSTVFEGGNRAARLMIIQSQPSREDDAAGAAFQGPEGVLLQAMLAAIGLDRDRDIYVGYCVPWCPPGGQEPSAINMQICAPFMRRQLALAAPDHVIIMGTGPAQMLLNSRRPIPHLRGQWHTLTVAERAVPALPMLTTSYLLDEPAFKRQTWQDLLSLKDTLEAAHQRVSLSDSD